MAMRRLVTVLGIASGIAACSGDDGGGPDARVVDGGGEAVVRDAGAGETAEAGAAVGLGANLSWYCPVGTASCPPSEVMAYNRCLLDRCEPSLQMCPCESWINCTTRCACGDLACRAACIPSFECLACGQAVARCVNESGCARPACYEPPPPEPAPDGAARDSIFIPPPFPVPAPAPSPDAAPAPGPAPDAGAATDGGLQGTCADLRRCCESLAAPARDTCLSQLTLLGTDQLCAAALLVYRGNGMCQ